MRYRLICWMLLGWFIAGYGYAQIRGGAETARFEPGDRILYQEDLSGTPIGSQVEGWEILQGSYEVAEFQDRRWFRPLAYNTHILRRMDFPQDFSVEFTTYLFEPGEAELRVFLHTEEDIKRGVGPDGYAQVYLKIFRTGNRDGFWFATWNATNRRWQVVVEDPRRLPPDTPHNVALQVRGGRLNLFIDGERVATTPFRPDAPLRAISFRFLSRKGHELPYKDRPALLDGIRIAGYSRPVGRATGGVFLYWMFPGGQENLPPAPGGAEPDH